MLLEFEQKLYSGSPLERAEPSKVLFEASVIAMVGRIRY